MTELMTRFTTAGTIILASHLTQAIIKKHINSTNK